MQCPFPGMDPYLERSEIWPDFHDSLIAYIREVLQPLLRPRYVAVTRDRLYVIESERPIWPDVSVVRTSAEVRTKDNRHAFQMDCDTPLVVEMFREEIREPLIHIIEPAAGNRIVAAIEVLSPDNKVSGPGRDSYGQKREELWEAGAHLVEIDLLRGGQPTVRVSEEKLHDLPRWRYLVAVTRCWPPQYELYTWGIDRRVPRVSIPLGGEDADVALDLQTAYQRCWEAGPYPELLRYSAPPAGELDQDELALCRQLLNNAGFNVTW